MPAGAARSHQVTAECVAVTTILVTLQFSRLLLVPFWTTSHIPLLMESPQGLGLPCLSLTVPLWDLLSASPTQ